MTPRSVPPATALRWGTFALLAVTLSLGAVVHVLEVPVEKASADARADAHDAAADRAVLLTDMRARLADFTHLLTLTAGGAVLFTGLLLARSHDGWRLMAAIAVLSTVTIVGAVVPGPIVASAAGHHAGALATRLAVGLAFPLALLVLLTGHASRAPRDLVVTGAVVAAAAAAAGHAWRAAWRAGAADGLQAPLDPTLHALGMSLPGLGAAVAFVLYAAALLVALNRERLHHPVVRENVARGAPVDGYGDPLSHDV